MPGAKTNEVLIRKERRIKLAGFLGLVILLLAGLFLIDNLLLSFVIAVVMSYLFLPLVHLFERAKTSRAAALTFIYLGLTAAFVFAVFLLLPLVSDQVMSLRDELPKYIEGTRDLIARFEKQIRVSSKNMVTLSLSARAEAFLLAKADYYFGMLPTLLGQFLTVLLLAPFFSFFMLLDGRGMTRKLLAIVPNQLFELVLNLSHQINYQMGGFIRARLLESVIVGLVIWGGLFLVGFPYAVLLSVFAAIMNLVPYVGPIIGVIPALIIAMIQSHEPTTILLLALVYAFAQFIDVVFVIPMVVARIVNLHPITVVLSIIIGSQAMGVLGMIISIPVASALKVIISSVYNHLIEFRS